ncbi:MAG: di-trans,poly-cis-decaprenylcistransferase [Flavobacteriales bacterium]|nr:di-trans,poly-cis-decaprenylcistransferase [Flavobacteriales bacterium]
MELRDRIDPARVPKHVAIIMDGNGRWAERQGEHRVVGHTSGVKAVRDTLVGATEIGIKYLTLYAFSTENWNRPQAEVDALMDLLVRTLMSELESLNENGVRLHAIGDLESLPGDCPAILQKAIASTAHNDRITLTLALSYSSRWELVRMAKQLGVVAARLCTAGMPDPELLIRTSGEQRISNYLLWQIAYAELFFTPALWPDFRKEDLFEAVLDYQHRERRFGLISEQVSPR